MASAEWPDLSEFDLADVQPWDRQHGEKSKEYEAFRVYRDMPPLQRSVPVVAERIGVGERRARQLAQRWRWHERADAWDDALHHVEDQERLEAIRAMHAVHRRAGRAAVMKAVQALSLLSPDEMKASDVVRMMALGARLERDTLLVSVEEMQGVEEFAEDEDDPWERIARELDPHTADDG